MENRCVDVNVKYNADMLRKFDVYKFIYVKVVGSYINNLIRVKVSNRALHLITILSPE